MPPRTTPVPRLLRVSTVCLCGSIGPLSTLLPSPICLFLVLLYLQVDIRVNEDAPTYPTIADSSLVPLGRLPLGGDDGSNTGVPYDPRPASEGGCSAGHLKGCSVYNIKVRHLLHDLECGKSLVG